MRDGSLFSKMLDFQKLYQRAGAMWIYRIHGMRWMDMMEMAAMTEEVIGMQKHSLRQNSHWQEDGHTLRF